MRINQIVKLIREEAQKYENATMLLPVGVIKVINGEKQEKEWGHISTGKVLQYLADMLEQ